MSDSFTPPSVVVGIDGSPAGVHAAVWAAEEALSRGIALRLIAVGDSATGMTAAFDAVRAARPDAKTETAVLAGKPVEVLLAESRDASMICVGPGPIAAALASSASCPVAVIRGAERPADREPGWVAVQVDETPESATVLQCGIEEARLRHAPLRVLRAGKSQRLIRPQLDERLAEWKQRYPDLDVRPVAVQGGMLPYIVRNATRIQLFVLGAHNAAGVAELLENGGECSLLVVDRQRLV